MKREAQFTVEGRSYPCPCCGYLVFSEPPGSFDICPVCFWEDDISQLRFARRVGANHVSLIEGQKNYALFGACEQGVKPYVRSAQSNDLREPGWRPINPDLDEIEEPIPGVIYGETYPKDPRRLYYWRDTYWRRGKT